MKTILSPFFLTRYIKRVLLLFIVVTAVFVSSNTQAQGQKGEITGNVVDAATKEALPYATVAVYTAHDTTMVTFRMSNDEGKFKVPGLPINQQLRVVITMVGLKVYRKEFSLTPEQPVHELGQIALEESASMLSEVLVVAEIPPVLIKNDTLEFNASSFKTLPTALVEDLLKKLPGVMVDAAGNITVNGKAVHKILVDGKEFFGSDPKIASRNLPADVIQKVQVMNDPEVVRRDPDLPEGDIPQVINLTFKKGIKKGIFGKVYGGAGTDNRYEGGGLLNAFRDTMQISVLGYSNNLNKAGFGMGDMRKIGGFDRSGMNSISVYSNGGYALNGVSFGAMGSGIQQSSGGGANFNTVTTNGIKLNLQYFYGRLDDDLDQLLNTRQFLENDTLVARKSKDRHSTNHSHNIGGKLEWKLDSLTDLSFTPSISFVQRTIGLNELTRTRYNAGELLNESDNNEKTNEDNTEFSGSYSVHRLFAKKGRIFNLNGNYTYGVALQGKYNSALNQFYEPEPQTTELNQLRNDDRNSLLLNNSVSFTEPLIKDLSTVVRLNTEYFKDENTIATFSRDEKSGAYDLPVDALSSSFDRKGWRNYMNAGLKWKVGDFTLQPSVRFTSLNIKSDFEEVPPIKQEYFYIFPSFNVRWKELNMSYNVYMREPQAVDLLPIVDNTNPLYIRYGNPGLKPTVSHTVSMNYYNHDMQKALNYSFYVYGRKSNDAITRKRTIEANGVQISQPVNTDGNWDLNGSASLSKDFKYESGRQFSVGASLWGGYHKTLIMLNGIESYSKRWDFGPSINAGFNLNDKIEFNQTLRFNFEGSRYENKVFTDQDFITRTSETGVVIRLPKKLVWEANFESWYNSNAVPGLQNNYGRLNAAVTYLFMKNDRAQLKLSVYDLLDQNISAYRSIQENIVEDSQSLTLTRYGLLTFTYNIRNFGGKVGSTSNNSLFRF